MNEPTGTQTTLEDIHFLREVSADLLAACQDALIATAEEGHFGTCQYCEAEGQDTLPHESWCWVPKVQAAVAKARQVSAACDDAYDKRQEPNMPILDKTHSFRLDQLAGVRTLTISVHCYLRAGRWR